MNTTVTTSDGFSVSSNFETPAAMQHALDDPAQKIKTTSITTDAAPAPTPAAPAAPADSGAAPADASAAAPAAAPVTEPEPPAPVGRKPPRETVQQRIDRAVAAQKDAQREIEFWKSKALGTSAPAEPAAPRAPDPPPVHPGFDPRDPEPTIELFAHAPDPAIAYLRALGLWSGRQEARALQRVTAQSARQAQADAVEVQRATNLNQGLTKHAAGGDPQKLVAFVESISEDVLSLQTFAQLPPGTIPTGGTAVADYIADHPDSAHLLMRYLSDHPDDLQRLSTLPPMHVFGQMGRLDERLSAAHTPGSAQAIPVSQARAPIKPVGGTPLTPVSGVPQESDDLVTFIKKGNALDPRINPKLRL